VAANLRLHVALGPQLGELHFKNIEGSHSIVKVMRPGKTVEGFTLQFCMEHHLSDVMINFVCAESWSSFYLSSSRR
jgi:hypothetical protein